VQGSKVAPPVRQGVFARLIGPWTISFVTFALFSFSLSRYAWLSLHLPHHRSLPMLALSLLLMLPLTRPVHSVVVLDSFDTGDVIFGAVSGVEQTGMFLSPTPTLRNVSRVTAIVRYGLLVGLRSIVDTISRVFNYHSVIAEKCRCDYSA